MKQIFRLVFASLLLLVSSFAWGLSPSRGVVIIDVLFSPQSKDISNLETRRIDYIVCRAKSEKFHQMVVDGYADQDEKNGKKLSEQRALAVWRAMLKKGVPASYFSMGGGGDPPENFKFVTGRGYEKFEAHAAPNNKRRVDVWFSFEDNAKASASCWHQHMLDLPLVQAIEFAKTQVVKGAARSHEPVLEAVRVGRVNLVEALLKPELGLPVVQPFRQELISSAALYGHVDIIKALQRAGFSAKDIITMGTPLTVGLCNQDYMKITEAFQLSIINALLALGDKPVYINKPLPSIYTWPDTDYSLACVAGPKGASWLVVETLLKAGANPNDPPEHSAAINAARYNPEIAKKLVEAGANAKQRTSGAYENDTLFHEYRLNKPADVQWLIGQGLDINARNKKGYSPFQVAARYAKADVLEAMVAAGARWDDVPLKELFMTRFQPLTPNVSSKPEHRLVTCYKCGNAEGLAWLIRKGISLDSEPYMLQRFAMRGDPDIEVIQALLDRGIDANRLGEQGQKPISSAITAFAPKTIKLLIERGAVVNQSEIAIAEKISPMLDPKAGLGCILGWSEKDLKDFNAPEKIAVRQTAKDEMIAFLKMNLKK
jgi:OmpA family